MPGSRDSSLLKTIFFPQFQPRVSSNSVSPSRPTTILRVVGLYKRYAPEPFSLPR
ncbi:hypothetical protein Hanom_Chr06g00569601 [Helianthus anomalus]